MKKTISFVVGKPGKLSIESHEVDLDSLSPIARELAERILTTDMSDDLSYVGLRCKYTRTELCKKIIADFEKNGALSRYGSFAYRNSQKIIADIENGDPWGVADQVLTSSYIWDSLKDDESPEAYFERHAKALESESAPYLYDSELAPVKRKSPQSRYDATHTTMITMKLNTTTDADILRKLQEVGNKQGYIKSLIRADMEKSE